MSKKKSGPKPGSQQSAREKMRAERAKQQAADKRKERTFRIGIGVLVAVVIIGIAGVVQWQRSQIGTGPSPKGTAAGYGKAPKSETEGQKKAKDGGKAADVAGFWRGVGTGKSSAPVVVEQFEDFSCPHCADLENAGFEKTLKPYIDKGQIRTVYYPVVLDQFKENGYGNDRAANAFGCAADLDKGNEYKEALYASTAQNQGKWTDSNLVDIGKEVGLDSGAFRACAKSTRFDPYLNSIDETMTDKGLTGTPTILVNGKQVKFTSQEGTLMVAETKAAIDQAVKKSGKK